MTNKEEIIDKYVNELTAKIDKLSEVYKTSLTDRKHMENGYRFAIMASVEALRKILDEPPKENGFKKFINKQLGLTPPTQADIDQEKARIEMEKTKLELAKIRAQTNELKKSGGDSPFASFIKAGNEYNSSVIKKKKDEK